MKGLFVKIMGRNGICEKFCVNLQLLYSTYIALRGSNSSLMSLKPTSMVALGPGG